MKNILKIKKFLIFSDAEFEIKRITVLIGPQSSGKSIAAKLLYLFLGFPLVVEEAVHNGEMKRKICDSMLKKFTEIFPKNTWIDNSFQITFETELGTLAFSYEVGKALSFTISPYYDKMLHRFFAMHKKLASSNQNKMKLISYLALSQSILSADWGMIAEQDNHIFIPAGRSFFASFDKNIFTFLYNSINIEYFLKAFGMYYEQCRNNISEYEEKRSSLQKELDVICKKFLHGTYFRKNQKDYIRTDAGKDSFVTEVRDSSSGQQELLPILLTVQSTKSSFLTIEEPEAHIYPESQYDIVRFLVSQQKWSSKTALLMTTHSPYVLTAVNNLAYAGILSAKLLAADKTDDWKKLGNIYPPDERISESELAAYLVKDGTIKNIIDTETGLINAEDLDCISNITNDKFSDLLALSLNCEKSASEE